MRKRRKKTQWLEFRIPGQTWVWRTDPHGNRELIFRNPSRKAVVIELPKGFEYEKTTIKSKSKGSPLQLHVKRTFKKLDKQREIPQ